jgi:hypothetical protein
MYQALADTFLSHILFCATQKESACRRYAAFDCALDLARWPGREKSTKKCVACSRCVICPESLDRDERF